MQRTNRPQAQLKPTNLKDTKPQSSILRQKDNMVRVQPMDRVVAINEKWGTAEELLDLFRDAWVRVFSI